MLLHLLLLLWPSYLPFMRTFVTILAYKGSLPTSRFLITFAKPLLLCKVIYSQILGIRAWTSLGDCFSTYQNNHEKLDNCLQIFEGRTDIWKMEERLDFFCVVLRDRIRTSGRKLQRDRFVLTLRENFSSHSELWGSSGQSQKAATYPRHR